MVVVSVTVATSGVQKPKRSREPNQLGKLIIDLSVGEADDSKNMPDQSEKDPATIALVKKGEGRKAHEISASADSKKCS